MAPTPATTATEMMQGMASETREVTSVTTVQGRPRLLTTLLNTKPYLSKYVHFRGLAPHFLKQDSIRSGYISDHESRSGYEHRGEQQGGVEQVPGFKLSCGLPCGIYNVCSENLRGAGLVTAGDCVQ